ncbi:ADP-ribosyltransferase [Streptomyces europaeiscabiei]|uniref:ADP-ribosyltransferase n=1 Tax=Streptomyces europaeiscabiei TaxID=146819 RepID=UPI0029B38A5F|nr:ADP-ribosyltransferase [Streptomyces europaeiscabiei]MDX3694948.1 ADP-ribosyltransferase [Streptomyces europaeiscabiei]
MCRSKAKGGRRCASSHPAVRAAARAVSPQLGRDAAAAGEDHPASAAYAQAEAWAQQAHEAAQAGDDASARDCAANAQECAQVTRVLLADRDADAVYPGSEKADVTALEEGRAAHALADVAGAGHAPVVPRSDGGYTVAWDQDGFAGAATVYPGDEDDDGHPHARLAFTNLDEDRYQALANSPWPYRTEDGAVVYDRLPADQARQVIEAARTGEPGKPWRRHGLTAAVSRTALTEDEAEELEDESYSWSQQITDMEETYVNEFTAEHFEEINSHLYNGKSPDEEVDGMGVPLGEVCAHLDSAIDRAPEPDQPHIIYRGFKPPREVIKSDRVLEWVKDNFKVGGVYRDDSYMSFSHCPEYAASFSPNKWIDSKTDKGEASHGVVFEAVTSRGAAVAAVSQYDNEERERLLKRGSTFHVIGIQENVRIAGANKVVVQLADVSDVPRF